MNTDTSGTSEDDKFREYFRTKLITATKSENIVSLQLIFSQISNFEYPNISFEHIRVRSLLLLNSFLHFLGAYKMGASILYIL